MERQSNELEVVAINDLADTNTYAHMFKYDTNYGVYPGEVNFDEKSITINNQNIRVLSSRNPEELNWGDFDIDIVIESTGFFTDGVKAAGHLKSGPKKVIISAPSTNEDITLVLGVNEDKYDN